MYVSSIGFRVQGEITAIVVTHGSVFSTNKKWYGNAEYLCTFDKTCSK